MNNTNTKKEKPHVRKQKSILKHTKRISNARSVITKRVSN